MTSLPEWERQLESDLARIRRDTEKLAAAAAAIRGRGDARGVSVEVSAAGDITDLLIAPSAMSWSGTQLASALLECHRKARADAKAKAERLLQQTDPQIRSRIQELKGGAATVPGLGDSDRPMTDEEIQAADDAYFQRLNRGWETNR